MLTTYNWTGIKTYYVGLALKAANLVSVHRNVMLQQENNYKFLKINSVIFV